MNLTENFTDKEFRCPCCKICEMDKHFMMELQGLRDVCGFPFFVTSGYRCLKHNTEVSKRSMNDHVKGCAVDVKCASRYQRAKILKEALEGGYFKDIAIAKTFIHLGEGKVNQGVGVY